MKNTKTRCFLFGVTMLFVTPLMAAEQGTDYGVLIDRFSTISNNFSDAIMPATKWLFIALLTLDLALFGKNYIWGDPTKALKSLSDRVLFYGFILAVINSDWLLDIVQGFIQLGQKGSGMSSFKPGDFMREGFNLISIMVNNYNQGAGGKFAILTNPFAAFTLGLCVILTLISFVILVGQYFVIMFQMYAYTAIAPVLLALGALKFTKDVSLKVVSTSLVIGVRMLMIFFVITGAREMVPLMGNDIAMATISNMQPLWNATGMAMLLAFLAIKAPTLATDILNGTSSLSAGDAVLPGVAAAAGAAGGAVAGAAASGANAAAQGLTSLREAASAHLSGGASSNTGGLSGMTGGYSPSTSSLSGMGGTNTQSDLNPSWWSDSSSSAFSGAGSTSAASPNGISGGDQSSSSGSISGGGGNVEQSSGSVPSNGGEQASSGGSISGGSSSGEPSTNAAPSNGSGGTIGGANASGQTSQPNSAVADHVSRGLQEFAQAEKSAGASVNIQLGHEDI